MVQGKENDKLKKEVNLKAMTDYYANFKNQFEVMKTQMEQGNFTAVDAWCAELVSGRMPVTGILNMSAKEVKQRQNNAAK